MHTLRTLSLAAMLAFSLATASADTVELQGASPGSDSARPSRGMTQAAVEARFGIPNRRVAAVGDPPISQWEYSGYIVYFEYDRVIHAVAKR